MARPDVLKTYRYLRIGMIGAAGLLAASIAVERGQVDCWQTSISAYYYTPVRVIFVGTLIAVGLALIAYNGRNIWEDISLNFAGMFAFVVAVAPTTDIGSCWSVAPDPLPVRDDGSLARWVVSNIDNNVYALLITASAGLAFAAVTAVTKERGLRGLTHHGRPVTRVSLAATGAILLLTWWLMATWDDFHTHAHGYAAVAFFVFLIGAIIANVFAHRAERDAAWFWIYAVAAALMVLGAIVIPTTRIFGDHTVFALESYEIVFFAAYWSVQTVENWNEAMHERRDQAGLSAMT